MAATGRARLGRIDRDCFYNAMAESLVDTYKTELIADRVWKTATEVELATVGWVDWYNRHPPARRTLRHPAGRVRAQRRRPPPAPPDSRAGGLSLRSPYGLTALDPAAHTIRCSKSKATNTSSWKPVRLRRALLPHARPHSVSRLRLARSYSEHLWSFQSPSRP